MSAHVADELWEYALGMLAPVEREAVEQHLTACGACTAELSAATETLSQVALELPPLAPSPELFEKILAATEPGAGRFAGVVDRLAELFDLARDEAGRLLDSVATALWSPSGISGVDLLHVAGGPAIAGCDAGLVRFAPRTRFPLHHHTGDEVMLILDGDVLEDDGRRGRAGDAMAKRAGTSHAFVVGDEGCLVAVLLKGPIEIDGVKIG